MAGSARYNVIAATAYGPMIVNRNDWQESGDSRFGVGWDLLETGRYAQEEQDLLATLIRACPAHPVLLDVGANVGVMSLLFSNLAGSGGRVYAFEAQRIVFQTLMGNLALNSVENVYAYNMAVGKQAGRLRLPIPQYHAPRNFGGVGFVSHPASPQADASEAVDLTTIDSMALERLDLIKVDVEGMEEDVLLGASHTIERLRPLLQLEWWGTDAGRLPRFLIDELGYRPFRAGINLICFPAEKPLPIPYPDHLEITLDGIDKAFAS